MTYQDFEPEEEEDEKSVERRRQLEIQKEIKALKKELKGGGKGQKSKANKEEEEGGNSTALQISWANFWLYSAMDLIFTLFGTFLILYILNLTFDL